MTTSPVPRRQFSPTLANTPARPPPAAVRTPPKPHRESPAHSVCHSRNSALHTRTLPLRPTILHNSTTSASRYPPLLHAPQNSHTQTPPAAPSAGPSAPTTSHNLQAGFPFGRRDRSKGAFRALSCEPIPSAASPEAPSRTTVRNPLSPFPGSLMVESSLHIQQHSAIRIDATT